MSVQRAQQSVQKKSYITTGDFSEFFYTYTTRVNANLSATGVWGQVAGTTDAPGTILRENGKKLVPGVHPDVDQLYVGVYDTVTFSSGYINPNEICFAVFNEDKPYFLANPTGYNPNSDQVHGVGSGPTYTFGQIQAIGNGDVDGKSGEIYAKWNGNGYHHVASNGDNSTGTTFTGLNGYNGEVHVSGLLRASNAANTATLTAGTTGAITISPLVNLTNAVVILGRQTYTGSALGVLTYTIDTVSATQTLTITSKKANGATETNDAGDVTYLIVAK